MDKNGIKNCLIIFVFCLLALTSINARAQDINPASQPLFTDQELDDILAPVALYPDPLLAQVLPASTYTEEILDAYDWLNSGGSISGIEWQRWDESVKAIVRYPDVLKMMAEYADWTADLGDAFLNQPEDVTRSVQRLRWQARDMGNLVSNNQQTIVIAGDYIEIIPARPQYIYVPSYDPSIVYYERYYSGSDPFITFGIGLMIGSWLTMDFDWGNHHIIYHGWNRPGWVNQARPHVHVKDLYVNRTRPFINKNWRHDNSHGNPDNFRTAHPGVASGSGMKSRVSEIRGKSVTSAPPPEGAVGDKRSSGNRGKENRDSNISRPATPSQDTRKQPSITVQGDRQRTESKTIDITKRPEPTASGSQRPVSQPPGIIKRPEQPPSDVSRRPASRTIGVTKRPEQPTTSGAGSPTQQTRSAPESVQRPKTPSVTFGGYRGANETKGQSMRGQASRQSSERARTSSVPVKKEEAPERKGTSRGDAPGDKQNTGDRQRR